MAQINCPTDVYCIDNKEAIALYVPMAVLEWLACAGAKASFLYSGAHGESALIQRSVAILMAHIGCSTGAIALTTNKQ